MSSEPTLYKKNNEKIITLTKTTAQINVMCLESHIFLVQTGILIGLEKQYYYTTLITDTAAFS